MPQTVKEGIDWRTEINQLNELKNQLTTILEQTDKGEVSIAVFNRQLLIIYPNGKIE